MNVAPELGSSHARVLWLDDEWAAVAPSCTFLRRHGVGVRVVSTGDEALAEMTKGKYSCLLLDERLPGTRGLEVLKATRSAGIRIPAIIVTGFATTELTVEALRLGAETVIEKPFRPAKILDAIKETWGVGLRSRLFVE